MSIYIYSVGEQNEYVSNSYRLVLSQIIFSRKKVLPLLIVRGFHSFRSNAMKKIDCTIIFESHYKDKRIKDIKMVR